MIQRVPSPQAIEVLSLTISLRGEATCRWIKPADRRINFLLVLCCLELVFHSKYRRP
jgi:hypothetical protein